MLVSVTVVEGDISSHITTAVFYYGVNLFTNTRFERPSKSTDKNLYQRFISFQDYILPQDPPNKYYMRSVEYVQ